MLLTDNTNISGLQYGSGNMYMKGEGKIVDALLRSRYPGERHLPMWVDGKLKVSLYTGPNTSLETRLKDYNNNLPINKLIRHLYPTMSLTLWQKKSRYTKSRPKDAIYSG